MWFVVYLRALAKMESSAKTPLVKRTDVQAATSSSDGATVQICCVESSRLARVPVIRTLFKKKEASEKVRFIVDNHWRVLYILTYPIAGDILFLHCCAAVYAGGCSRDRQHMEVPKNRS